MNDINHLLDTLQEGDPVAADQLLVLVYSELRRLAAAKMSRETPGQTLQPTALVHEAWLRLGGEGQRWENRAHFFGAAAEAMRRILIDRADGEARLDLRPRVALPGNQKVKRPCAILALARQDWRQVPIESRAAFHLTRAAEEAGF